MMAELDDVPSTVTVTTRSDAEGIFTHLDPVEDDANDETPSSSLVTLSVSELSSEVIDKALDGGTMEVVGEVDAEEVVEEVVGSGSVAGMVSGASLLLVEEVDVSVGLAATTGSSEETGTFVVLFSFSFSAFYIRRRENKRQISSPFTREHRIREERANLAFFLLQS